MRKKIFVDTNVLADLLLHRQDFYDDAARLFSLFDKKKFIGCVASFSFATISYLLEKYAKLTSEQIGEQFQKVSTLVKIIPLDEKVLYQSFDVKSSGFSDIEDSMQYFSAKKAKCSFIITRNKKDFEKSEIPVFTADEFLNSL